ncbi:neurotensin receptor type 1-like [Pseudoliparis swirei]|uniref:neurotensin receptor type 1-like n=1 Tax=Pseudoliparis swirei TaxID=2059687 RepID=UPI0024BE2BD4|nr:neurotensin receptor type 1-like [Pseudoliparis swirei]
MDHSLTLARTLFGNDSLFPFENTSSPAGQEEQQEDLEVNTDLYSRVAVTVIYAALFAVGALGNAVTLATLRAKKRVRGLQGTVHYHLASLAASDLLILLLSMPLELHSFVWFHHPWLFGDAVCRGYYFLRDGCSYATALNVASLSAERYLAVCHPFKAKRLMSRSRTKKLIGAVWLASFALAAPMLLVMGQVTRHGENICTATVSPGASRAGAAGGVMVFQVSQVLQVSYVLHSGAGMPYAPQAQVSQAQIPQPHPPLLSCVTDAVESHRLGSTTQDLKWEPKSPITKAEDAFRGS